MKIAACQLSSGLDRATNLATAADLVRQAGDQGAELVILPENVGYLGPASTAPSPERVTGPFATFFSELASELKLWIVAGSFLESGAPGRRAYNTSLLFNPIGTIVAVYRKIHLYDVDIPGKVSARESAYAAPGDEIVVTKVNNIYIGLSICYDLRFPELYRALVAQGAQLLAVPAAFRTHTGKDHWEVLLRARAIENQCYVVAAAQIGEDPAGRSHYGHSMIIDPWGTILAQAPDTTGVITAEIDFDHLATIRTQLPALKNRRLSL